MKEKDPAFVEMERFKTSLMIKNLAVEYILLWGLIVIRPDSIFSYML